jgi:imidazolonepropionase-like amidohydrolase
VKRLNFSFERGLALLLATAAAATSLGAQTIAITGGRVFPVSGPVIENGTVVIQNGRITAVGANVAVPAGARRIDATGKWVTPGLINSGTEIGLQEISSVASTREFTAKGKDGIAAAFRATDGLNPASVLIPPTRKDGITTVVVLPQGGLVAGQAGIIDLVEGTASDMVLRPSVAMLGQVGDAQEAGVGARGELLLRLRELFADTRAYQRNRTAFERGDVRELSASRLDLEAMIPVLEGRLPMIVAVDKASDIEAALGLAKEYGLKIMIGGGAEAWMVAEKLAAANVPVLTGAMNNIPTSFSTLGQRQENAGLLRRAGVTVAMIGNAEGGDEETFNARNIRYEAGNAVAYGMSWNDALAAVTLSPARMFGVAERVGSLQPGREGNVVVWSGDPFEFSTLAEHVFVRGREYSAPTRQDDLIERYKTLPPAYNSPAPTPAQAPE